MKEIVLNMIQDATLLMDDSKANAVAISKELNASRNIISQYLNEYFNAGILIKINTRPVIFFDKHLIEEHYSCILDESEYISLSAFQDLIENEKNKDFENLIGYDESLSTVINQCRATISYPPEGLPMLLYGPTGTGKSMIAQTMYDYCIHQNLIEKDKQFLILNCSEFANNPELLTANLFGYKKGAFTGADKDNPGLLKVAEGGILFLDEVHALKAECQEKLFLFMDKGIYHRMGDNEKWIHSHVRLLFATTENPQKVLLKTLLRRIPMMITLPSLQERGVHERIQLIYHLFKKEEKRLNKKIQFSNIVYNALVSTVFPGNIGDLKNCIQASCVNAYYNCDPSGNTLQIHAYHLPANLIELNELAKQKIVDNQVAMIPLDDLRKYINHDRAQVHLNNQILEVNEELIELKTSFADFLDKSFQYLNEYNDHTIYQKNTKQSSGFLYVQSMLSNIFDIISNRYGLKISNNDLLTFATYIHDYTRYNFELRNYFDKHQIEITNLYKNVNERIHREFLIAQEIAQSIHANADIELDEMAISVLTLYLKKFNRIMDCNKRIGIILTHGYSTASSISDATNRLLEQYIFDAIDMPLQVSNEEIVEQLNDYLNKIGSYDEIVLLVDMGSLEDIHKGISSSAHANIGIINNVTIKMALEVGNGIRQGESLETIFKKVDQAALPTHHIIHYHHKDPVILCSCASGLGTADRLKKILEESIPKSLVVKILTYDYNELIEKQLNSTFFEQYEVICIVGTLNPNLDDVPFIPIEDLIINVSLDKLHHYFKDYLSIDDMKIFKTNILKNFSLTNIMNSLTILNPTKLLEQVSSAIEDLQQRLQTSFSNNTCVGLYVHVCCLIERLVMHQDIDQYPNINDFVKQQEHFIQCVKAAFSPIEHYYMIEVMPPEIGFIYDYVENDASEKGNKEKEDENSL
ncbi:MAG: sigma 54-interacting transcriptional regulator [Erysipelotrichaceae bacterium]